MDRIGADLAVALVAQRIDARHVQQPRVLRTVRGVACHAPFPFDHSVLVYERSTHIHVAFRADHVLIGRDSQIAALKRSMGVVTVRTFDPTLVHRMVERHVKRPLHVGVATHAERRLRQFQQGLFALRRMNTMAAGATQAGLGVRRAIEIRVYSRVATETGGIDLLRGRLAGQENLGNVSTALHVRLPWSVAALAGDSLAAMRQSQFRMRIVGKALAHFRMASNTGIGAHIAGCPGSGCWGSLGCVRLLARLTRGVCRSGIAESE